jgi:hypothetical protein
MVIKVTIEDELYKELKTLAKSKNEFIMGFCNKLFTDKVKELLSQNMQEKVQ